MGAEALEGRRPIRLGEFALAVLGYLAVCWLYWEPFFSEPALHYSVGRDYFQNSWNIWWTRFAWEGGQAFYECDYLFAPRGTSLAFHTITFANTLPGLFLRDWFGVTETHSILFLAAFLCSALGGWALARYVTGSAWGAFAAGLFYAFNPYHTAMVTQLNNAQFQWIPLFFLAVLLLYDTGRWRHVLWGGIVLALAGYADWYQPVFCALGLVCLLTWLLFRDRRWFDGRLWGKLVLLGGLGAVIMLPGVLPLVEVMGQMGEDLEVPIRYVGEMGLLGIVPQGSPYFHFWPVVIGWSTCLLLAWAMFKGRPRGSGMWWLLFVFAFVFLQGPYIMIFHRPVEWLPMPMALFPHLPVLSIIRVPHRFLILLVLAIGVLLAFGLRELLLRERLRKLAPVIAIGLSALIALELQPKQREPIELAYADVYDDMAVDEDHYNVLELPLDFRDGYTMWLQTIHEKPMIAGYTSHILPNATLALQTPLMRSLLPSEVDTDIGHLPQFLKQRVDELDQTVIDDWRREIRSDKNIGVILFHHAPDFPESEADFPPNETTMQKLRIAMTPFRFNRLANDPEHWRMLAFSRGQRTLAERSAQARAIIERMFGPPDYTQGRDGKTEVWDLRRPR